jgi:hypothetical protein
MEQVQGYFVGLDLGQAQDYTALAVIEAADTKGEWDPVNLYFGRHRELRLRHLERMPLGRPYPEMVARTGQVMRSGALISASRWLAVDATGVGRPVVDLLQLQKLPCLLWPAVITGGQRKATGMGFTKCPSGSCWWVCR